MAEMTMPEPPKGHYWRVWKHDPFIGPEQLVVGLYRRWAFTPVGESRNTEWLLDPEGNALNAIELAEEILAMKMHENNGLNGLSGFKWGRVA